LQAVESQTLGTLWSFRSSKLGTAFGGVLADSEGKLTSGPTTGRDRPFLPGGGCKKGGKNAAIKRLNFLTTRLLEVMHQVVTHELVADSRGLSS